LNAINEIERFFIDVPKEFFIYQNDIKTKRAVERNIEIIGEAMNRILKQNAGFIFDRFPKIRRC
jgi:uncharacterized protein with HEPN domain